MKKHPYTELYSLCARVKTFSKRSTPRKCSLKAGLAGLLCEVCLPVICYVPLMQQPFVLFFVLALVWWTNKFISEGFLCMGINTSIWAFTESAVQPQLVFIPLDEHRWTRRENQSSINASHNKTLRDEQQRATGHTWTEYYYCKRIAHTQLNINIIINKYNYFFALRIK